MYSNIYTHDVKLASRVPPPIRLHKIGITHFNYRPIWITKAFRACAGLDFSSRNNWNNWFNLTWARRINVKLTVYSFELSLALWIIFDRTLAIYTAIYTRDSQGSRITFTIPKTGVLLNFLIEPKATHSTHLKISVRFSWRRPRLDRNKKWQNYLVRIFQKFSFRWPCVSRLPIQYSRLARSCLRVRTTRVASFLSLTPPLTLRSLFRADGNFTPLLSISQSSAYTLFQSGGEESCRLRMNYNGAERSVSWGCFIV